LRPGATGRKIAKLFCVPHALQARASQIMKPYHWLHEKEKAVPFPGFSFDYRRLWVQTSTGKHMLLAFPITVHHRHHQRPQRGSCSVVCVSLMVTDPGTRTPYTQGLKFFTPIEILRRIGIVFLTPHVHKNENYCPQFTKTSQELNINPTLDFTLHFFTFPILFL
jgi:hypothetical protein